MRLTKRNSSFLFEKGLIPHLVKHIRDMETEIVILPERLGDTPHLK